MNAKKCEEKTITWQDLLNESKAVARAILKDKSDKVIICAKEGSIRWMECNIGVLLAGGVPTHLNPSCSIQHFKQCIETCKSKWLFIDSNNVCFNIQSFLNKHYGT